MNSPASTLKFLNLTLEDFDFSHLQKEAISQSTQKLDAIETKTNITKPKIEDLTIDDDHIAKILQRGSKVEIRQKFFKDLFQKYKKLTRKQIIEITGISPGTATKDLQALCQAGMIEKRQPTKSVKSHYFVWVE